MITEIISLGGQQYCVRYKIENGIVLDSIYHLDGYGINITEDIEEEFIELIKTTK